MSSSCGSNSVSSQLAFASGVNSFTTGNGSIDLAARGPATVLEHQRTLFGGDEMHVLGFRRLLYAPWGTAPPPGRGSALQFDPRSAPKVEPHPTGQAFSYRNHLRNFDRSHCSTPMGVKRRADSQRWAPKPPQGGRETADLRPTPDAYGRAAYAAVAASPAEPSGCGFDQMDRAVLDPGNTCTEKLRNVCGPPPRPASTARPKPASSKADLAMGLSTPQNTAEGSSPKRCIQYPKRRSSRIVARRRLSRCRPTCSGISYAG